MKGKVKFFNNEKGYGFITGEDNKDIFVHYSQIMSDGYKTLKNDQEVSFEVIITDKGPQAQKVEVI